MEKNEIIKKLVKLHEETGAITMDDLKKYVSEESTEFEEIIIELENDGIYLEEKSDLPEVEDILDTEETAEPEEPVEDEDDDFIDLDELSDEDLSADELVDFVDYAKEIEEELMRDKQYDTSVSIKVDDPVTFCAGADE